MKSQRTIRVIVNQKNDRKYQNDEKPQVREWWRGQNTEHNRMEHNWNIT
jgi:hypothetical protein